MCDAFQRAVTRYADRVALRTLDDRVALTWSQLGDRVRALASGLAALGVKRGDTVAALLPNVPELHALDWATVHLGAIPFTIYNSSSPDQIAHQLENADCRILITQSSLLPKVIQAQADVPKLRHVIVTDGEGGTATLADLESGGDPEFSFEDTWRSVTPGDYLALIYTSGTTGPPKAALWCHGSAMAQLRALDAAHPLPRRNIISLLPMAHAGARITSHYIALCYGATVTCSPDMSELARDIAAIHPDSLFCPPRVWEKLQVAIERRLDGAPAADAKFTRPVLEATGLDRMKIAFIGGASSAPELTAFFRAVGVPLVEAYGSTECGLCVFNTIDRFKLGTAGFPLPGVEMRVDAEDGELLLRSPFTFHGYRNQPDATAAALDADGWVHTGDIATIDPDGFLTIVDRKKEIIISAAGKNMSPANIEQAIKAQTSLIGQIVTIGEGRRYNAALVTLDPEAAPAVAAKLGVGGGSHAELAGHPAMIDQIQAAVTAGNQRLSRVEQVKKFLVLPTPWTPDSDELTPTMKLRRRQIAEKYATEIEGLYAD